MKLIRTTEVTSIPDGVKTPLVTPWLQHPTYRSNTPRDTMFKTSKNLNIQYFVHLLKKISDDEVLL